MIYIVDDGWQAPTSGVCDRRAVCFRGVRSTSTTPSNCSDAKIRSVAADDIDLPSARSCFLDMHGDCLRVIRKTLSTRREAYMAPYNYPWDSNPRSGPRTDKLRSMFSVLECHCRALCAMGLWQRKSAEKFNTLHTGHPQPSRGDHGGSGTPAGVAGDPRRRAQRRTECARARARGARESPRQGRG